MKNTKHTIDYKMILDHACDWETWETIEGLKYVSPACASISGYTNQEFLEDPDLMSRIVMETDRGRWLQHRQEVMDRVGLRTEQYKIRRKDGAQVWIEHTCQPLYDDNGNYMGHRGNNRDISLRVELEEYLKNREDELFAREATLSSIITTVPDGMAIANLDGTLRYASVKAVEMWGYDSEAEILGKSVLEFVDETYHEKALYLIGEMLKGNLTGPAEYLMRRKNGTQFYAEANADILRDAKGNPTGVLYIDRDITKRKKDEADAAYYHEFQKMISSISNDFISGTPGEMNAIINSTLKQCGMFFGADRGFLFQLDEGGLRLTNTHEWCRAGMVSLIDTNQDLLLQDYRWVFEQYKKDNRFYVPDVKALPEEAEKIRDRWLQQDIGSSFSVPLLRHGDMIGVLGFEAVNPSSLTLGDHTQLLNIVANTLSEALEKNRILKELEELSVTDQLTRLYNRHKLEHALNQESKRFARYGTMFSVVLLDIDYFKSINDNFGHQTGDQVLIQLAKILKDHSRETDYVGRWGGEEFLVLMPESTPEHAQDAAEKWRIEIESHDFGIGKTVTCSFGTTSFRKEDNIDTMIIRADQALYQAKGDGRNRVVGK